MVVESAVNNPLQPKPYNEQYNYSVSPRTSYRTTSECGWIRSGISAEFRCDSLPVHKQAVQVLEDLLDVHVGISADWWRDGVSW